MEARQVVSEAAPDRVSSRLLLFVFDLIRHHGVDPRPLAADLVTIGSGPQVPPWVSWSDYIEMIHRLGEIAGGARGVAATMRATLETAYDDLRGLAGFFSGPLSFFTFVLHQLNRELVPAAIGEVELLGPSRARVRYRISEPMRPSKLYLEGTVTLTEVFPSHFDLPEASVEVLHLDERTSEVLVELPEPRPKLRWGRHLEPLDDVSHVLTQREQEVLRLVCTGLTNAQIARALGTAPSTVKTQISSILGKMDVTNRTELAALASRKP